MNTLFKIEKPLVLFFLFFIFIFTQITFDEFNIEDTFIVFLYLIITLLSKNFIFRYKVIFAPQNIAYLVFFMRLYILPFISIFYKDRNFNDINMIDPNIIFNSYLITLTMYLAFVIGWEIYCRKKKRIVNQNFSLSKFSIKMIVFFFSCIGIITIINVVSDFQGYIYTVYLNKTDDEILDNGNKFLDLLQGLAKYFLPFVVIGFLSLTNLQSKTKVSKYLLLISSCLLVLLFSLNSNRQSMIYPLVALIVGFSKYIKFKSFPIVAFGLISLYFVFTFSNIRSVNNSQSNKSLKNTEEIIKDVQVYAGGAQVVAPVFKYDGLKFTIFNSFISSFPILGTPYREESGVILYNYLFYGYTGVVDQVFLTQAECYLNGGYPLIIFFFIIVGYYYSKLNKLFFSRINSQFLYVVALYYIILLFNSTILLGFQVMGQFLFYNSLPALIILKFYRNNRLNMINIKRPIQKKHINII